MALGIKTEEILNNLNNNENEELLQNQKDTSVVADVLAAPFRGIEGAAQGIYQFADFLSFDYLPDYDNRFLGKSETIAGSLVEGITQFVVPYAGIAKGVSAVGKATKFAKPFMKTNKKGKEVLNWKGVLAAETATDFLAFEAQEERLSNLMQAYGPLSNPVAEYLAADDDDGEVEGRLKNALEGLGITGAVAGSFQLALKAHKKWKANPEEGKKISEQQQIKQIRTVPLEAYSPAVKASKNVYTKSKKIKDGGVMAHQLRKEFDAYGEKGTGEELRWMGFDDWLAEKGTKRVTQKEVDKFLEEKQLQYKLKERTGTDTNGVYEDFKQKGGDNYREFILETNDDAVRLASENVNQHFNERTLLHYRTTDRTDDVDNSRVLYVEELQSDIIQKNRDNDFTEGKQIPLEDSYIPAAMRMIMQLASKEGYDKVSWATPQQIANLYDAAVDNIKLNSVNDDGVRSFDITKNGRTETKVAKNDDEVVAIFGKKAADELTSRLVKAGDETGEYTVKQDSKAFNQYKDKMVSAVNKVAKPFGGKVEMSKTDRTKEAMSLGEEYRVAMKELEDISGNGSYELMFDFQQSDFIDKWKQSVVRRGGQNVSAEKAFIQDFEFELNRFGLDEDEIERLEGLENFDDLFDAVNDSLDADLIDLFKDTLDNQFNKYNPEVPSKNFDSAQPSFSINLNDGMKKSVEEIRLWGLKTGDEAQMGGQINDPALEQVLSIPALRYLNDKEVMKTERDFGGSIANETTAKFALERLAANGSTPQVKKIAEGLLQMFGKDNDFLNTSVRSIIEDSDSFGSFGFRQDGGQNIELYTNRTDIVKGNIRGDEVFGEATLLHELVHAGQVRFIPKEISTISNLKGEAYLAKVDELIDSADTKPAVKRLLESYRTALDNAPEEFKGIVGSLNDASGYLRSAPNNRDSLKQWYGLSNVDEFLAEAMTSNQFQNFLRSVKTGNTNLWDNIVQVLKDLFGVDAKGTLLGDTLSNFADLVSKQNNKYALDNYTTPYTNPIKSRGQRINENRFFQSSGSSKEGILVTERGGKIAVEGTVKSIGEAETAYDIGELLAKTEEKVLEEMEKTGSIGFYEDGKIVASDGLKGGGIVQAVEQARVLAEAAGQKIDIVESEIKAAGRDQGALRRIAARMYTVESMAIAQGDEIVKKAQAIASAGAEVTDSARAELLGDVQKMLNLVAAGSNLRRGFGQGLQSTQFARTKLSLSSAERRSQEIVNQYMASNKGAKKDFDKLINNIILAGKDPRNTTSKAMIDQMLGVAKSARASEGGKFMEMTQNWFINSLLSGPRTMMKNGIGNMITQTLLQTELAVGGITVDPAITRHVLKEMATFESFRESMQYFLKVYSMQDQLLDIGRNPLENTAKTGLPKYFDNAAPEETMKQSLNWFSENVVNIPAKTLMAMDEVFKQSVFRQNAKLEFTLKGMKLGIKDPDELTEYVMKGLDAVLVDGERAFSDAGVMKYAQAAIKKMDDEAVAGGGKAMTPQERGAKVNAIIQEEIAKREGMVKSVQEGGLGIEDISDLDNIAARSLEQARYATFTNDAGAFADLAQAMVQKVPILGLIFPFIRTPVNILKFSFDRASFGAVEAGRNILAKMPDLPMLKQTQEQLRLQLESRNPIEVARARGKLATAAMINSTLLYMIFSNREFITGGGPKNDAERRTLEGTGWQRYSFKFGKTYAGYSGLDPFGTQFGVLVDLVEQFDKNGSVNTTVGEQVFAAATISLTRNVTDKSYLAGLQFITDALSEPDRKMERAIRNIAGGFVPNVLYQTQSVVGDTTSKEVRSLSDAFMKKLPFGNDDLDPKRNILGESITMEQVPIAGPFNPSAISTRDGDAVFEELAKLEHGFTQTSTMLDRTIDMTEFANDKGQSAYDRRLELLSTTKIRGRTLRQELEKLISSKRYLRLSPLTEGGFKSPRVGLINKVIGKYRSRSLSLMMEEFPEIETQYNNLRKAKSLSKRGASADQIMNLIDLTP